MLKAMVATRKRALVVMGILMVFCLIQQAMADVDTAAAEQEINKVGQLIINLCKGPIVKGLMIIFFIVAGVSIGKQNYGAAFGWAIAGFICAFAPQIANAVFK